MQEKILTSRRQNILITAGLKLGKLTVGELVQFASEHPLFLLTKISYVQNGRLRECECDCGQSVLISENALSSGNVKSCGCLVREKRELAHKEKLLREEKKSYLKDLNYKISVEQTKLRLLLIQPIHLRQTKESNLAVTATAAELRKLFALKGHAKRK